MTGPRSGRRMHPEVFLVRHGETAWNAEERFQGQLDSPLTQHGREQAAQNGKLLAAALAGRGAVAMHVSPLGRAQQTAAIIRTQGTYASPMNEPRIQEVTTGTWDGLTHDGIEAGWPGLLDGATAFDWYFRAPDGEAYDAAVTRVRAWLDTVEGSVVAVSHGLVGRLIRGAYLGLPQEEALVLPVPQDVVWHLVHGRVEALTA